MAVELLVIEGSGKAITATALVNHSCTQAKLIRLDRVRLGDSNGELYICMRLMVVELVAIEGSRKWIKATVLVIHSCTQETLIRLYRARSGGSNGVLHVCMLFMVMELMTIEKSEIGRKAIVLAIHGRTQVKMIRPDRAELSHSSG